MITYIEPKIEIIYLETEDIITTSPVDVPEELPIQPLKWEML